MGSLFCCQKCLVSLKLWWQCGRRVEEKGNQGNETMSWRWRGNDDECQQGKYRRLQHRYSKRMRKVWGNGLKENNGSSRSDVSTQLQKKFWGSRHAPLKWASGSSPFVLFRETESLWENWLIAKTAFPSPRCNMSCVHLVGAARSHHTRWCQNMSKAALQRTDRFLRTTDVCLSVTRIEWYDQYLWCQPTNQGTMTVMNMSFMMELRNSRRFPLRLFCLTRSWRQNLQF